VPYLIFSTPTESEKKHQLKFGTNTIGRSQDNTVVVMDDSLSRRHAEIIVTENQIVIRDLGSLNHTFVNEIQITQCTIKDGDWIRCGNLKFRLGDELNEFRGKTAPTDLGTTVVKQINTERTSLMVQDLLSPYTGQKSAIRIAQKDATERTTRKLEILLLLSKELSSPEEPERLLPKILDLLFEIMNVDRAAILFLNEENKELEAKALRGRDRDCLLEKEFYSKSIISRVCCDGTAIVTADASVDERLDGSESIIAKSIHASMCVPLKAREKVIGVLYVDNLSMSDIYTDEDVEFLSALANQAAIAIENARLYEQMEREAVMRTKLERFFPVAVTQKLREGDKLEIVDTEITALFADISNFTTMSSTMEPRQVIVMLNEYFQVMVEKIVFKYEGTLEKYIGDALFAIWGAPYKKTNDTERAIQAAVDMQWAVIDLNRHWVKQGKQCIQIHIGINTGQVAAGNIGSDKLIQYATIGDTTNTTSRICNVAQAGEIVIGQTTYEKIAHLKLPLEKLPPTFVKGKDRALDLYRLNWRQISSQITLTS
jgi:class 3 adenylate cyclase/pSer/pThr/pTyr-binding forkhead associated (FHA) protein